MKDDAKNQDEQNSEPIQFAFQSYIDSLPGTILPQYRYRIEKLLSSNAFTAVFSTVNEAKDTMVVMRVFRRFVKSDEDYQYGRFKQEVKRLSGLKHQNISSIVDHGLLPEGLPFIITETISGPTLEEVLISQNRIDPDQAMLIFSQVGRAVQFAHDNGVLHETMKPSRIFISENEREEPIVITTGFGLFSLHHKLGVALKTPTSRQALIGTAAYMAPEQCVEDVETDGRTDVYSIGCVMYESLGGQVPFLDDDAKVIKMHCEKDPVALGVLRKDLNLPKRLLSIVEKCMQKDVVRRYQFVKDLQLDLEKDIDPSERDKQTALPEGLERAHQRVKETKSYPIKQAVTLIGGLFVLIGVLIGGYYAYTYTSKFANSAGWLSKLQAGQKALTDGKIAEADENLRAALSEARNFPGTDMRVATTLNEVANLDTITGHYKTAIDNLREALDVEHAILSRDDETAARTLELLSVAELDCDRLREAEEHARASAEMAEHVSGDHTLRLYQSYIQLFRVLLAKNNLNEANIALKKIKAAFDATNSMLSIEAVTGYKQGLAQLDEASGKNAAAEKQFLDVLGTRQEKIGLLSLPSIETMIFLGKLYFAEKKYDKSATIMKSAYDAKAKMFGESSPALTELGLTVGQIYDKCGKKAEAEEYIRRAAEESEKLWGARSIERLPYLDALAKFLRANKQITAAEVYENEALEIRHPERVPQLGKGR